MERRFFLLVLLLITGCRTTGSVSINHRIDTGAGQTEVSIKIDLWNSQKTR